MEDRKNNIWLGLDNGINCINLGSPFWEYIDSKGILGSVYASCIFENNLYLGTNQGLFWKQLNTPGNFNFVSNTGGQVWTLFTYDGRLFCGHDKGTFLISEGRANSIARINGTWSLLNIPSKPNWLPSGQLYRDACAKKN